MAYYCIERTKLNFQPGSVSLLQYPVRPGNDYRHHRQQDCHQRQADYNEACTPNPQLRVEDSELEGAVPPGMVDSTM